MESIKYKLKQNAYETRKDDLKEGNWETVGNWQLAVGSWQSTRNAEPGTRNQEPGT